MIVVITGGTAGVGRATALQFARSGWDVAVIARDPGRLESTCRELRAHGVKALSVAADVADHGAVYEAAAEIELELGPIDVWVNNAMVTVFAAVADLKPDEIRRVTEVTYLGQVNGTLAALAQMRSRNRGVIVNVGSALAYRAIPLQAAYCGAKFAVRGFTDSLRIELRHEGRAIDVVMVQLPAVNTPQFDWALNKTGHRVQPVPPIFQPEVAARAIHRAATRPGPREIWLALPTISAILANRLCPGLLDRYLVKAGYRCQLSGEKLPAGAPAKLENCVPGNAAAHGRFDRRARRSTWWRL